MKWLSSHKIVVTLLMLSVIFFVLYSGFNLTSIAPEARNYGGNMIFSWPDAMANNFFIQQFVKTGELAWEEPLNIALQGIVHPRSTNIVDASIVPTGFLGMLIIYGWLGKILRSYILYLTPLVAVFSVWLFYAIIKKVFNDTVAFFTALLLFSLAPFWYYASQTMLATIPFVFFLLLGVFLISQIAETFSANKKTLFVALAGLSVGFALIIRPIEFIWVGLMLIIIAIFQWKEIKWHQILIFAMAAALPLFIMIFYNYQTYGEYFTLGYLKTNTIAPIFERLPGEFRVSGSSKVISLLKFIFIPFGFNPKVIALTFYNYFIKFLWPFILFFVLGLIVWLKNKSEKIQRVYFVSGIMAGAWLIFYYGNWLFIDKLVLKNNVIGSSYARYWLPLYILILPVIAYFFFWLRRQKFSCYLISILIAIFISGLFIFSAYYVLAAPGDGLLAQREVTRVYYDQAKKVDALVEKNAIIISDRADKLFFPQRQTIVFDLNYAIFPILKKVVNAVPFYYLTLMPDKDINYINERKIANLGLKFDSPRQIDEQFRLFRLSAK